MITPDGWLDWAERRPGPVDKKYTQVNTAQGFVPHSAVGFYQGWLGRLDSTERNPDGSYSHYASASVHLWVEKNGHVIQHYPFTASCWASGNRIANTTKIAAEHAGGEKGHESEPFTPEQVAADLRIISELSAAYHWTPQRHTPAIETDTLLEHNECVRFWGPPSGATACPSHRVPWHLYLTNGQHQPDVEDDCTMPVPWIRDNATGRSYVIVGGKKRHVENAAQEAALIKAGYIKAPEVVMSTAELATIPDA